MTIGFGSGWEFDEEALCPAGWAPNAATVSMAERLLGAFRARRRALEIASDAAATAAGAARTGHEIHPISAAEMRVLAVNFDWFEDMAEGAPAGRAVRATSKVQLPL